MWKFLSKNKESDSEDFKVIFLKEYFNSSDQKKTILKAARESAKDQRDLMDRYKELIKKEKQTA